MVIHLYSLTAGPADVAGLTGVDGAPLRPVACGPLHAVVSDHAAAPEASREHALAHAVAVAAVCDRATALPVRFGAQHADEAALRRAVIDRVHGLTSAIMRLGGHFELLVRHSRPPAPAPAPVPATTPPGAHGPSPGRRYLEQRLHDERASRAARAELHEELRQVTEDLDDVVVDVLERDGPAGPERCLLVTASRAAEAADRLAPRIDERQTLLMAGPWPPYSFAGDLT